MKTSSAVKLLLAAVFLFALQDSVQAREPYKGEYRGHEMRKAKKAKPKSAKLVATCSIVQSGPTSYDSQATINASGGGEKLVIVLNLDAANNGTLTINGNLIAGPGAKSRIAPHAKKLKVQLKATGTATFVGPIRQTLTMTGKAGKIPFTVTGVVDLDSAGGLILNLDIKFSKDTPLGTSASFAFSGARL